MSATPRTAAHHEGLHQLRRAHHHEIRGALNALRLQLTLLQRGRQKAPPDDPRFGQWVEGAADGADAVENALGELSQVELVDEIGGGHAPLSVAQRVGQLLEPLAKSRQVRIECGPAREAGSPSDGGVEAGATTGGLARALLEAGAERLVTAEPGATLSFRVGSRGVDVSPDPLHLSFDQLSESPPDV